VEEEVKLGIEHVQSQSHSMVETTVLDTTLIILPVMLTHVLVCNILFTKKSLKVPKVQSEAVSRGMTTNTMAQGKNNK
jgi:hypothetical protein